ncbi:hypothetical protein N7462_004348 [Penicillium macrosclerotiorum]|uniref:uncharacterized protein n=1 Tax=Penicillium macrosclerotiorum TaxID=303699 RepID=UPI0025469D24|nr:uncharacterized protein N7462_004348 [Penicillium macrosclerotiorum]KAJ5689956.1 hypothetical protein N7462_004348 [Penicillium macrosclerotiorum]
MAATIIMHYSHSQDHVSVLPVLEILSEEDAPAPSPDNPYQSTFFQLSILQEILPETCTLADQGIQIQEVSPSAIVLSPPVVGNPRNLPKGDGLFSFLRHFASPSVKIDRLAIGETANLSIRRNLEALHSHLEDALIPTNAMSGFMVDPRIAEFSMRLTSSTDYLLSEYPNEALFPSKLSNQLMELMEELVEASRSMSDGETQQPLDMTDLATMLGASNISNFISAFFQSLHWHLPVVHFPTFDPGNVSSPLLLAISLAGAAYSLPLDGASFSPWILDVAEEYIFRKISNLSANSSPTDPCHLIPTVQLIQSALIMEMLQFGRDDMQVRRRIRITRHPCLVSTIRSFGIFKLKRRTAPKECDEWTWKVLVAEEMCIRYAILTLPGLTSSLLDGFLTVCFKNHPALSVFEMDCDFPWSSELWEAEDAASFSHIAAARLNQPALPSLKKVIEQLLETPKTAASMSWSTSLSPEHLLILIYAMSSLAFQARSGLFKYLSLETISQAAANWKRIWDAAVNSLDQQKFLHLGYPKHAEELWWLLNATLNATGNQDKTFSYLDNTATDELGNLNEFIQWCQRST